MNKLLYTLAFLICIAAIPAKAQVSPAFSARMSQVFDSVCTKYNIKGATAAVLVPGVGIWKGTHGISQAGKPITDDMAMGIGSNTKTFTSVALLKLQEQGMLSLDDTIGTWFKGYKNIDGKVTIRQMLNHTSGINSYTEYPYMNDSLLADMERIWKPEELLPFIGTKDFVRGAGWNYSNSNYLLSGIIIEKVTGKKYHEAIRDLILTPHGLNHTFVFPQETPMAPVPHSWSMNFGFPYLTDEEVFGYSHKAMFSMASAAGAIMSTAEDNTRFWDMLRTGVLITEQSWKEMRQMRRLNASADYGLGMFRYRNFNGRTCFSHGGTNIGFINENIVDSVSGISFSILTNQDSIGNSILLASVLREMHKVTLQTPATVIYHKPQNLMELNLYPNPANQVLYFESETQLPLKSRFRLADLTGKTVLDIHVNGDSAHISLSMLTSGFYIATLISPDNAILYRQKVQVVR